MTSKSERDDWIRTRDLNNDGWSLTEGVVRHSRTETIEHFVAKAIAYKHIRDAGRGASTEAEHETQGRVDVLDHGPAESFPVAVEIESSPNPKRVREKALRYSSETLVRDVLVLDLRDAPERVDAFAGWVAGQLP